jgi:hypothetical protein
MSFMRTLFGGSESKSGLDPRFKGLFDENVTGAKADASNLSARTFADFTPDWLKGADMTRNTAQNGAGFGAMTTAADALTNSLSYKPDQVNAGPAVTAGSFTNANIGAYMNPYLDQVANRTMQGVERSRQIAQVNDASKMTAAGAFGNSRRGVVDSLTNEAYDRNAQDALAKLYAGGFDKATDLFTTDSDRALTADKFNATQSLDAQKANQRAGLDAADLGQRAAVNLSNVGKGQLDAGYAAGREMRGIGSEIQDFSQAQLDALRNLPIERRKMIQDALGLNVGGGSGMTSTSTSSTGIVPAVGSFLGGMSSAARAGAGRS